MNHSLNEKLKSAFSNIEFDIPGEDRLVISVQKEAVLSVLSFLKNHGYNHLGLISCVDWIEKQIFELVYILSAYMQKDDEYTKKERMSIVLKTKISREKSE